MFPLPLAGEGEGGGFSAKSLFDNKQIGVSAPLPNPDREREDKFPPHHPPPSCEKCHKIIPSITKVFI
jgi:hypothetical protein